jgi:hypothetical protein
MPSARVPIFSRRRFLMKIERTSDPGPVWRWFVKRKIVPTALTDQSRADVPKRACSPVLGLLIWSSPPTSVGSSVLPGSGAITPSRATNTRRSDAELFRSTSLLPARRTSAARAEASTPVTRATARKARRERIRRAAPRRVAGAERPSS